MRDASDDNNNSLASLGSEFSRVNLRVDNTQIDNLSQVSNVKSSFNNYTSEDNLDQGSVIETPMTSGGVSIITRPIGVVSRKEGGVAISERNVLQENPWDIASWVKRPQVIESFKWTTALPSLQILRTYNFPVDLISVAPFLRQPFMSFKYWRGSVSLHLQTVATQTHLGTVIMYYVPLNRKDNDFTAQTFTNPCQMTSLQHTILHANSSTSSVLEIPYTYMTPYIDVYDRSDADSGIMGTVVVAVFNPLSVATGATDSADVSLVINMPDSEYKIPRYVPQPLVLEKGRFKPQGLTKTITGQSLGSIVSKMLPKNIVADSIDWVAGFFGLDKPTSIERSAPVKIIGTQYLNSSVEVDYIDKFSLFPAQLQETDATTFGTDANECDFDIRKQQYTYLGSFAMTAGSAEGEVLATMPITCCPAPIIVDPSNNYMPNNIPLLQYLSMPFAFWKGSINVKLQAVATSFHNAKIFVAINYGQYDPMPILVDLPSITSQYGAAFELNQGSTEFEFTIPYVSRYHQLTVPNGPAYHERNCMGTMSIIVMNELATSNNVSSDAIFNVFIAGGSDFELNTMAYTNNSVVPYIPQGPTFEAQGMFSSPQSNTSFSEGKNTISPEKQVKKRVDINDQSIRSLLQPLKKYNLVSKFLLPFVHDNVLPYQLLDLLSIMRPPDYSHAISYIPDSYNMLMYYAALYMGFRGPLRFKIVKNFTERPNNVDCTFKVGFIPYGSYAGPVSGITAPYANGVQWLDHSLPPGNAGPLSRPRTHMSIVNSVQGTAEIEIPFISPQNFDKIPWANYGGTVRADSSWGGLLYIMPDGFNIDQGTNMTFDIYAAFGDETKLGVFAGVPAVTTIKGNAGFPPSPDAYTQTASPLFTLSGTPL